VRSGIGQGLLLRQLARRHDHKAERFERYSSVAVFDLHLPHDTLPMPAVRRFRLRPPRFLHQQGQGGLLEDVSEVLVCYCLGVYETQSNPQATRVIA
jgi:hypothetical protein